jgi:hypothetical protein
MSDVIGAGNFFSLVRHLDVVLVICEFFRSVLFLRERQCTPRSSDAELPVLLYFTWCFLRISPL